MSNFSHRKDVHPNCDACDFQKLKELENNPTVRNLRDKIEQLSFRLGECKTENQMLKRNLQLAKKMVYQEVGANVDDFQALMKHGTEEGWKGRQENVLVLKKRVQELKDYLRELEGDPKEEEHNNRLKQPGKQKFWRMELERRLARESAEKDINPLVQECYELRKTLDNERNRFKELSEEVKILRAELQSQVARNEEEVGLVNSYQTLEKQLQEVLAERGEVRQELDGFRIRNKRLTEELEYLRKELEMQQNKTRESENLIHSLTSNHKAIQESIEVEKAIVQQNTDRYKEDLETLTKNHAKDVDILDQLQAIMCNRNSMIDELKTDVNEGLQGGDRSRQALDRVKKRGNDMKTGSANRSPAAKESKESKTTGTSPSSRGTQPGHQPKSKRHQDSLECEKYKALCQAARIESTYFLNVIARQEKMMNDVAKQVVETGQLAIQKNVEKKELLDKVGRLQQSLSAKRKRKRSVPSKSKLDEIRIRCEAQKDENDFLRNFLVGALGGKAEDIDFYKECVADHKHFFKAATRNIRESLKSSGADPAGQQSQEIVDPVENGSLS